MRALMSSAVSLVAAVRPMKALSRRRSWLVWAIHLPTREELMMAGANDLILGYAEFDDTHCGKAVLVHVGKRYQTVWENGSLVR